MTHFDLANNYGPPLRQRRGELRAAAAPATSRPTATSSSSPPRPATTCGPGPTASGARASTCSASLDQSLRRMGLDYVDIFYSHRFDPETPLEETMSALDAAVRRARRCTRASPPTRPRTEEAAAILRDLGTPLLIHQPSYSMLNRWIEEDLLDVLEREGIGLHRLLAAGAGHAHRQVPAAACRPTRGPRRTLPRARHADPRGAGPRPGAQRDGAGARAVAWPSWRWPGRCATRASPRCSSARAACASSTRTSPPCENLDFSDEELAQIDRTRSTRASTSGSSPARSSRPARPWRDAEVRRTVPVNGSHLRRSAPRRGRACAHAVACASDPGDPGSRAGPARPAGRARPRQPPHRSAAQLGDCCRWSCAGAGVPLAPVRR